MEFVSLEVKVEYIILQKCALEKLGNFLEKIEDMK